MGCVISPAPGNRKMPETQSNPWVGDGERNELVPMYMTGSAVCVKWLQRSREEAAGIF